MSPYEKRRFELIEEEKPREYHVVSDEHGEERLEQKLQNKKAQHVRHDQKDDHRSAAELELRVSDQEAKPRSKPISVTRNEEHNRIYRSARADQELSDRVSQSLSVSPKEAISGHRLEVETDRAAGKRVEQERQSTQVEHALQQADNLPTRSIRNSEIQLKENQPWHQQVRLHRIEEERFDENRKSTEIEQPVRQTDHAPTRTARELEPTSEEIRHLQPVESDRVAHKRLDEQRNSVQADHPARQTDIAPMPFVREPAIEVAIDQTRHHQRNEPYFHMPAISEPKFQSDHDLCDLIEQNKEVEPWQLVYEINELEQPVAEEIEHNEPERIDLRALAAVRRQRADHVRECTERFALSSYAQPDPATRDEREDEKSEPLPVPVQCIVPFDLAVELPELGPLEPEIIKYLHDNYSFLKKYVSVDYTRTEHAAALSEDFSRSADHLGAMIAARNDVCPERQIRAQAQIERLESVKEEARISPVDKYVAINIVSDEKNTCFELDDAVSAKWTNTELTPPLQKIIDDRSTSALSTAQEKGRPTHSLDERTNDPLIQQQTEVSQRKLIRTIDRDLVERHECDMDRIMEDEPPPGHFVTIMITEGPKHPVQVTVLGFWTARTVDEFMRHDPEAEPTDAAMSHIIEVEKRWRTWLERIGRGRADLQQSRRQSRDDYEYDDFDR